MPTTPAAAKLPPIAFERPRRGLCHPPGVRCPQVKVALVGNKQWTHLNSSPPPWGLLLPDTSAMPGGSWRSCPAWSLHLHSAQPESSPAGRHFQRRRGGKRRRTDHTGAFPPRWAKGTTRGWWAVGREGLPTPYVSKELNSAVRVHSPVEMYSSQHCQLWNRCY